MLTREQYIEIAVQAGFDVINGALVFYEGKPATLKPNYEASVADGLKLAIQFAYDAGRNDERLRAGNICMQKTDELLSPLQKEHGTRICLELAREIFKGE